MSTCTIIDYTIASGLIIWENYNELSKQDAAWNSFRGLSSPLESDFRFKLKIGYVSARKLNPDHGGIHLHGTGMLLRFVGGVMLGFVFTGQSRNAYLV